jgi:hypothetical protein
MSQSERPLTDHALARLRELGEGNGLSAETIELKESDEKTVTLTGALFLTPQAELKTQRLIGKGYKLPKVDRSFDSFADLSNFMTEKQQEFQTKGKWFDEVKLDLDKLPGKGWGLVDARIVLDQKPELNASAAETCLSCSGRGALTCHYCAGRGANPCMACGERGSERCYHCFGTGRNPQDQEQPCGICAGTAFVVCRSCQGRRGTPCGNCQAAGVLSCDPCGGAGQTLELATLSFGADATFKPGSSGELPAALRRGIDRAGGLKTLANGHAVIDYSVPKDEEQPKKGVLVLNYTANLACADIVLRIQGKAQRIAVFGQKRVMLDVPPYLDAALAKGLQSVEQAAQGKVRLTEALDYRAIREISTLVLNGKAPLEQIRKIYPLGLSKAMMQRIVRQLRRALARMTLVARWAGLVTAVIVADIIGGAFYLTSLHATTVQNVGRLGGLALEILIPLVCAGLGYLLTGQAALWHLRQVFPKAKIGAHHHGGTLALVAAVLAFCIPFVISLFARDPVLWRHF